MMFIGIFFILFQISKCDVDFINILLRGDPKEIYNLENPRETILQSVSFLNRINLSNYQKAVIWDVFKAHREPEELTADDLRNVTELLNAIPEADLSHLNVTDWNIVQILGGVTTFSRSQASVIANSLRITWGSKLLTQAHHINQLNALICGFPEDELSKIPKREFKKINSTVFASLFACSDSQLTVLHDHVIHLYGRPQSWSEHLIRHIGMIILALSKSEVRSLRPTSLKGLNIETITKFKPGLFKAFSDEQLRSLSASSKMRMHEIFFLLKSSSKSAKLEEICFLMGLFLRAYLLLKF